MRLAQNYQGGWILSSADKDVGKGHPQELQVSFEIIMQVQWFRPARRDPTPAECTPRALDEAPGHHCADLSPGECPT